MIKSTFLLVVITMLVAATSSAQDSKTYDTDAEMQEQMQLIVETLGLDVKETYALGQIMNDKKLKKDKALAQIETIKTQMQDYELNAQKDIQGMLSPEQWATFQKEIAPKLESKTTERLENKK